MLGKISSLSFISLFCFVVGSGEPALGQVGLSSAPTQAKNGVWYQVKAAIKARPKQTEQGATQSDPSAVMSVQLLISAHSAGSNFFGHPTQKFEFKLIDGADEKLYWQDSACHLQRSIPKVSVIAIDGTVERDGRKTDIKSRPRQIGLKVPTDEISAGTRLERSIEGDRQIITFQASTKTSRLDVIVKIYSVNCAL